MTLDVERYVGIEPTPPGLDGQCSTVKLIAHLERAAGIEPTLTIWTTVVLPLYDARMVPDGWEGRPVGGWHSARAFRRVGATGGN